MLEDKKYYMNPHTGSVCTGKEWVENFYSSPLNKILQLTTKDSLSFLKRKDDLIEVVKNKNDEWEEV